MENLTSAQMIKRGEDIKTMLQNEGWKWIKEEINNLVKNNRNTLERIAIDAKDVSVINNLGITIRAYEYILEMPERFINEGKRIVGKEIKKGGKNNGR